MKKALAIAALAAVLCSGCNSGNEARKDMPPVSLEYKAVMEPCDKMFRDISYGHLEVYDKESILKESEAESRYLWQTP